MITVGCLKTVKETRICCSLELLVVIRMYPWALPQGLKEGREDVTIETLIFCKPSSGVCGACVFYQG